jgi:hypothetical protein
MTTPGQFWTVEEIYVAEKIQKFLKSRKSSAVRCYVSLILRYLSDKMTDTKNAGWVTSTNMSKDLVHPDRIPNKSTFYKLLGDLENAELIEKCISVDTRTRPGPRPSYYRVFINYKKMGCNMDDIISLTTEYMTIYKGLEDCRREYVGIVATADNVDALICLGHELKQAMIRLESTRDRMAKQQVMLPMLPPIDSNMTRNT